jgi:hypothetical protein
LAVAANNHHFEGNITEVKTVTLADDSSFLAYVDGADSNYGKYRIYDNNSNLIAKGVFNQGATSNLSVTALQTGGAVIAYTDDSNSGYGTLTAIAADGTIMTDETVFNSANTPSLTITELTNGYLFLAYNDNGTGKYAVVSQNNIVIFSEAQFSAGSVSNLQAVSINDQILLAYIDQADADIVKATWFNIDDYDYSTAAVSSVAANVLTAVKLATGEAMLAYGTADSGQIAVIDQSQTITHSTTFSAAAVDSITLSAIAAARAVISYQVAGQVYYKVLDNTGRGLSAATEIASAVTALTSAIDNSGKLRISYIDGATAAIKQLSLTTALGYEAISDSSIWYDLTVAAETADTIILEGGNQYSQPIELTVGENVIDLGFITYEFTSVAGDNYIYLPGYGFGAKDVRSVMDETGRVYEANKINSFIYIIPDMGTGKQVTVDYTANVDSQNLRVVDNVDPDSLTVKSAVTLLPAGAAELVATRFVGGNDLVAYVDQSDGLAKFIISAENETRTGIISDSQISDLVAVSLANGNVLWLSATTHLALVKR